MGKRLLSRENERRFSIKFDRCNGRPHGEYLHLIKLLLYVRNKNIGENRSMASLILLSMEESEVCS